MRSDEIRELVTEARAAADRYDAQIPVPAVDFVEREAGRVLQVHLRRVADALEATLPAPQEREVIALQVRRHCTLTLPDGSVPSDATIQAVADWIENPPEWVPTYVSPDTDNRGTDCSDEATLPREDEGDVRERIGRAIYEAERALSRTGEHWISWERLVEKDQELSDERSAKYGSEKYRLLADAALAAFPGLGRETEPTIGEWLKAMDVERARQIEKGFDDAHDERHGVNHLLGYAIDYSRRGRGLAAATMVREAIKHIARKSEPSEQMVKRAEEVYREHATGYSMRDGGRTYTCRCGEAWSGEDARDEANLHRMGLALTAAGLWRDIAAEIETEVSNDLFGEFDRGLRRAAAIARGER